MGDFWGENTDSQVKRDWGRKVILTRADCGLDRTRRRGPRSSGRAIARFGVG